MQGATATVRSSEGMGVRVSSVAEGTQAWRKSDIGYSAHAACSHTHVHLPVGPIFGHDLPQSKTVCIYSGPAVSGCGVTTACGGKSEQHLQPAMPFNVMDIATTSANGMCRCATIHSSITAASVHCRKLT